MKQLLLACSVLVIICGNTLPTSASDVGTVVGINNRVETTLGGVDWTTYSESSTFAGLNYNPVLTGDFVETVDFILLNWDPILSRGLRVGLNATSIGSVERIGDPISPWNGNSYLVDFSSMGGTIDGITPALGYSGSLKLMRSADTISGYYLNPTTNAWVLISEQNNFYTGPTTVGFSIWAHTEAASGRQVAFDNFSLTGYNGLSVTDQFSGGINGANWTTYISSPSPPVNPVPEPSTLLLFGSGLLGLVGYGRRRFKK